MAPFSQDKEPPRIPGRFIQTEKESARDKLLKHTASKYALRINLWEKRQEIESLRSRAENNTNKGILLSEKIKKLEQAINSAQIGAEKLNHYLKLYFGKQDIEVRADHADRFRLYRGDSLAENLSEGEKTAIAFSYFIVSLSQKGTNKENLIVFIDDPISSLDANHTFNTFAIIKTELANVEQLFLSTHDYSFFKMMKGDSFFKEIVNDKRRTSFYLITRDSGSSSINDMPASLKRYNSEYHYLFNMLKKYSEADDYSDNDLWLIPNITRRLLEIYTSFKIPKTTTTLDQRLIELCEHPETAHRIYKFVNHYSHSGSASGAYEFPQPSECRSIVEEVFRMIEKNDELHFKGMIDVCAA